MSGPLCLYCAERFFRYIRSCDPVTIVTAIRHPCDVIELRMLKDNFAARPGQVFMEGNPTTTIPQTRNIRFSVSTSLMTFDLPLHLLLPPRLFQYIVLNCPGVSSFQNHPFTLTTVRSLLGSETFFILLIDSCVVGECVLPCSEP